MPNLWFRMYSEFASDPKVQSMPEPMQRRLVMIMCLRSCDVLVTLRDDEIAFALRITNEELEQTKSLFVAKNFIDDSWVLLNWEKRQYSSDSSKERTKRWRVRHRDGIVTAEKRHGDGPDTDTDTDTDKIKPHLLSTDAEHVKKQSRIDQDFEEDWPEFWSKVGKGAARKSYAKSRKKISREELVAAIRAQGSQIMARAKAQGITPIYPATWMNQERWSDDVASLVVPIRASTRQQVTDETKRKLEEKYGVKL